VVLANLVVRRDRRKKGLGKLLLRACEEKALSWGFAEMYLQVSSLNAGAQKLYTSQGNIYIYIYLFQVVLVILPWVIILVNIFFAYGHHSYMFRLQTCICG